MASARELAPLPVAELPMRCPAKDERLSQASAGDEHPRTLPAEAAAALRRKGGLPGWRARRITEQIDQNIASAIGIDDLARSANLSTSQFRRAFKISFGIAPHAFILARRVALAQDMILNSTESLSQIAVACGLSDQAHLCNVFRRAVGMPPHQWRCHRHVDHRRGAGRDVHACQRGPHAETAIASRPARD